MTAAHADIKLKQAVTWRQRHAFDLTRIPCGDQQTTQIGVCFDHFDNSGDLIDLPAIGGLPAPPLLAVDRPEIAVFISPFIPDADTVFLQIGDIRIAAEKPDQLMDNDRI